MCTGAEVAAIAGTAAQQYGSQQQSRDMSREAQRRADEAMRLNDRAGARVSQQVSDLKTSTADAGATEKTKLQNDFMTALRRAQIEGGSGLDSTPGATSDQYNADTAKARGANVTGNRAAATNLALIDAPFMQRVRENTGNARLTTDLSRIENQGRGQDFLSQLRMSMIKPNAGLEAAGDFLTGWGNARAQRAPKAPRAAGGMANAYDGAPTYNEDYNA